MDIAHSTAWHKLYTSTRQCVSIPYSTVPLQFICMLTDSCRETTVASVAPSPRALPANEQNLDPNGVQRSAVRAGPSVFANVYSFRTRRPGAERVGSTNFQNSFSVFWTDARYVRVAGQTDSSSMKSCSRFHATMGSSIDPQSVILLTLPVLAGAPPPYANTAI